MVQVLLGFIEMRNCGPKLKRTASPQRTGSPFFLRAGQTRLRKSQKQSALARLTYFQFDFACETLAGRYAKSQQYWF